MEEDRPTAIAKDLAYLIGFVTGYRKTKDLIREAEFEAFKRAYPEIFRIPVLNDEIPEEETS